MKKGKVLLKPLFLSFLFRFLAMLPKKHLQQRVMQIKTANLVVAVAFKKPAMCVDTHVHKITNRLGYVKTKNPLETEFALRKILPKTAVLPLS